MCRFKNENNYNHQSIKMDIELVADPIEPVADPIETVAHPFLVRQVAAVGIYRYPFAYMPIWEAKFRQIAPQNAVITEDMCDLFLHECYYELSRLGINIWHNNVMIYVENFALSYVATLNFDDMNIQE